MEKNIHNYKYNDNNTNVINTHTLALQGVSKQKHIRKVVTTLKFT